MNKHLIFFIFLFFITSSAALSRSSIDFEQLGADCKELEEFDNTDDFLTTSPKEAKAIARCQMAIDMSIYFAEEICGIGGSALLSKEKLRENIIERKRLLCKKKFRRNTYCGWCDDQK